MRKLFLPISMIILVALILAACSGAATPASSTGGQAPVTGATSGAGTGTVAPTSSSGAGASTAAPTGSATTGASTGSGASSATNNNTPSAANGTSTVASGNVGATANANASTATATNGGVATTAPTVSTTGTPAAGTSSSGSGNTGTTNNGTSGTGSTGNAGAANSTGVAGATNAFSQGQLIKLSDILQSSVVGSDKMNLGRVDGLLIERPVLPGEGQPTPAAGQATSTPMPTASAPQQVFLRYILVNVNSGATGQAGNVGNAQSGGQIVVPWQAVTGGTSVSSAAGSQSLALDVTANDLASAPHTTLLDVVSGSNAWMTPLASYWSGKGVSIPATGANSGAAGSSNNAQQTAMLFIPRERGGIDITDIKGNAFGQASDLLIDAKTGEIMYVILPASPTNTNQTIAVPMRLLTWTIGQGAAQITNRGALVFNFDTSVLKNFPNLGNLSNLITDPNVLNQLNNFWNSIQGSGTSK